ncbi:MAG: hypothetical protein FJY74_06385 [Candidatus Eisenbacteria bacterium]|nr:hypothetical protein [Candidatus Eisenbacteria bacterium]
MTRRTRSLCGLLLAIAVLSLQLGCAATKPEDVPGDPKLIRDELARIDNDIANSEEMLKGSRAQLQVDDSQDLRNEIRVYEANIAKLKSRKAALQQRLRELEAAKP